MKKTENAVEQTPKKRLRIVKVDDFTREKFKVNVGEEYDVEHEMKGEVHYGYLINTNTKRKLPIVMYAHQIELL